MTYSSAASKFRVPSSAFRVETYRDSPAPSSDPSDTVPVRWLPDMSSELRPVTRPSSFRMDMSDMARPVSRPLSWRPEMSAFMRPVPHVTSTRATARQEGTVPSAAPRSSAVVRVLSGLLGGGGGGHHGGHHGGGRHGGHRGGRGWGGRGWGGWGGGWGYPLYYDYYPLYERTYDSMLPLAVEEVSRMLSREPELVSVMDAYAPERVVVTVRSPGAANRVRSMTPASVRGVPVVVTIGNQLVAQTAIHGLAGMFSGHLFSGLDTGIEGGVSGLGASMQINLRSGDAVVRSLQEQLLRIGALPAPPTDRSPVDGKWGPVTASAVRTAAAMVGYTAQPAYVVLGTTVTVPPDLIAAISRYTPPARTVEPGTETSTTTVGPGQMVPTAVSAPASRKWLPWALVGGGVVVAGTLVLMMTRKPRAVAANRRRARRSRR